MQTVVNLDPDVEEFLSSEVRARNIERDQALNEAVRAGMSRRITQPTYDLGLEGHFNVDKALAFADRIEDEEILRRLKLAETK